MGNRHKSGGATSQRPELDPNEDRYPDLDAVLNEIRRHPDFFDGPVERLEIHLLPSGEGACRVWAPKAEEPLVVAYKSA